MIELEELEGGVVIPVRAQPNAKRNAITGEHNGMLKVAVTAAPEDGKANKAIADVLARSLGVAKSKVQLLSGQTNRQKRFHVEHLSIEQVRIKILSVE
ncbi:MAG: DUF167 domain-containing protein [Planctomycetales bacterium]|nr:DUF167 domain-containing protein [Planctomycetales bacterium]